MRISDWSSDVCSSDLTARASGGSVGLDNQLNTIRLNPAPVRGVGGKPYKSPPARGGKRILVVDDICTEGNSFEAARAYLRAAGAQAVCVSWLKTINTDYRAVSPALGRSEEHTSELQSLMRISYAVF